MNQQQTTLTQLLGSNEPTLTDFYRWLLLVRSETNGLLKFMFEQNESRIYIEWCFEHKSESIPYNSSLTLLEQPEEVKQKIIDFISSYLLIHNYEHIQTESPRGFEADATYEERRIWV